MKWNLLGYIDQLKAQYDLDHLNRCEHKKHWKIANYVNHRPEKTQEMITFSTKGDYRVSEKSGIIFFSYFNNLLFTKSQKFAPH